MFTRTTPGAAATTYLGSLDSDEATRITDGSRTMLAALPRERGVRLLGIDAAGLVAQPFDLDRLITTSEPVLVMAGVAAASISANGVLATSAASSRPITVPTWFDRQGTSLGAIGSPGTIQGVALGPDGRTVAANESGGSGIWLRDATGTNRRINPEGGDSPVWSPDGTRLVVAAPRDGVSNMFERAADGSGREVRLFPAERNAFPNDWSRDGKWIVFTLPKADLDLDLWVIPMDATADRKPMPYVTGPERDAQAEFSPDGRFVAYTSFTTGDPEVYVQPFPNAADGKWLVSNGGGSEPHWSRDGKELFYIAGQTVMSVPVTLTPTFSSGTPVRLFDAPVQQWYTNDTDRSQVAPDGKRFLLLVPAGKTSAPPIDIVVNWPTLLRTKN